MSTQYKGSVLSSTEQPTSTSSATGIWTTSDVMQAQKASTWVTLSFPTEFLLIAGGGPGGWNYCGGGGAGGVVLSSALTVTPSTSYTVTIGAGGTPPAGTGTVPGSFFSQHSSNFQPVLLVGAAAFEQQEF